MLTKCYQPRLQMLQLANSSICLFLRTSSSFFLYLAFSWPSCKRKKDRPCSKTFEFYSIARFGKREDACPRLDRPIRLISPSEIRPFDYFRFAWWDHLPQGGGEIKFNSKFYSQMGLRIETEGFFVKGSSRADKFWVDGVRYPWDLIGRVLCNAIHSSPSTQLSACSDSLHV